MVQVLGDYPADQTVRFKWNTTDASGASITRATDGTIYVYKDDDTGTETTTGVTDTEDFDSVTGVHHCKIVTTDSWYETGCDYFVVLKAATIDGQTVNACLASFSIANRTPQVNLIQIGGNSATSGNTATLSLASLSIQNSNGPAIFARSTGGSNSHGIYALGATTGAGIHAMGGNTGDGIYATGGASSGNGVSANAQAGGTGIIANGAGAYAGIEANGGGTGHGIEANGGATSGDGILAIGTTSGHGISAYGTDTDKNGIYALGNNSNGMYVRSGGGNGQGLMAVGNGSGHGINISGGATGNGINTSGGATSGHGIAASGSSTAGDGINATSATAGHGIYAEGSGADKNGIYAMADSHSGIYARSSGGNGNGILAVGQGSGHGISSTGGATGNGVLATGGATSGDGINAIAATLGHGIAGEGVGADKNGLYAKGNSSAGIYARCGGSNSHGIQAIGQGSGHGISATAGATGNGIDANGGATSGDGINATGGTNGNGINAVGGSTSGDGILANGNVSGHGIDSLGVGADKCGIYSAGGSSHGIYARSTGSGGNGILAVGNLAGNGMQLNGGTSGDGLVAAGGATNGEGAVFTGQGTGAGLNATGSGTGHGISATASDTGDGFNAVSDGAGDGFNVSSDGGGYGMVTTGAAWSAILDRLSFNTFNEIKADMRSINQNPATVDDLATFAESGIGDDGGVIRSSEDTVSDIADAVWDEMRSGHTDTGSYGETLSELDSGVNVTSVEGKTLSGKTGDNFDYFFNNGGGDTTNTVDDVGAAGSNPNMLLSTTIASITDQTHFVLTAGSDQDDAYKDQAIAIYDATNNDYPSVRLVSAYTGSTKTVTLDSAPDFTIAGADGVKIFVTAPGTTAPTAAQNADAVWDETRSGHVGTGTFGETVGDLNGVLPSSAIADAATMSRIAGLVFENSYRHTRVYNADDELTSEKVDVYNSKANATTHDGTTGIVAKYTVTYAYSEDNVSTMLFVRDS